ncbi:hypothetical protein DDB_G0287025 [Dictyostelium discoideum AX4]|uniref:Ras guanine nucleotide exchange factor glfB-like C-terminal domain-containing protein n=1 Tax=Dictyostelium discoideum TaxID=44689 RepID=Q54KZ2_DICDI|nr:hypothetical protein DDB_G0287025 [Dictyostelium discoideum AX4]EAL63939.1 hypothetical protein DDB_G0287025 [Dictyostelium discoideum AX4]|eukprot:XP_637440.1 hypothetical protein DDB_G0287025 [Dictyostelium discoideum AX4]
MKSNNSTATTYTLKKPAIEIPLDKQIDKLFQKPLQRLPVFKDLPRLAGRIIIEKYTPQVATTITSEPSSSSSSSSSSTTTTATTTTTTTTENIQSSDNTITSIESVDTNKKRKSKALSLKLSKDFGELGKDNEDKLEVEPLESQETNENKVWKTVKSVIFKLSELYENEETQNKIKSTFNSEKAPSDYQLSLPQLFNECMEEKTSKVIKILKLIHQNIIYIGCYELKINVPYLMVNLTKDVRGPEGWRINVFKGKDITTVIHTRREEAMDKKFYFEWQLHITLSGKDLDEISFASLKIIDLVFDPSASLQFKQEVSRSLCNGNLFVM